MKILLTGGMGYIGSHCAVVLAAAGHEIVIVDNLSNSDIGVLARVRRITNRPMDFIEADIRDRARLEDILRHHGIEAVVHFAGLKAVGESVAQPLRYFDNNVNGTLCLLEAMQAADVRRLIFSSSATVYGAPQYLPLDESHPTGATNPYGRTKLHIEEILQDVARADPRWRIVSLRYFNPVGAHDSGLIGEDPSGIPNNLMPYITRVAIGALPALSIFGQDYETADGTGVRDYIHVMDLAEGHSAALAYAATTDKAYDVFNLGTGQGYSVLEMVAAFARVNGVPIPYHFAPRRAGDVARCYAKADKAARLLHWRATRSLEDMCASSWRFQQARSLV